MNLKIECADRNGDVFIDLVDRSSPRALQLIATMERGFDMKENAQLIVGCVNGWKSLKQQRDDLLISLHELKEKIEIDIGKCSL